jgi:RNA polymerase sigma factor (sigma-70 family)
LDKQEKYSLDELLNGIANSDAKVLNHLYKENFKLIRHFVISNNGNVEDARDIFQESLVVLFRKVQEENFKLTSSLSTFIYSIARLMWLKELSIRKKRAESRSADQEYSSQELEVIDLIDYNEKLKLFREKFEELSEDCKKVLRMFLNNVPIKEITKSMGYSSDQHTKNRRFRCKKSLVLNIRKSRKYKELRNEKNQDDRDLPRW